MKSTKKNIILLAIFIFFKVSLVFATRSETHLYANFDHLNHDLFKPVIGVESPQAIGEKITFYVFYQNTAKFVRMEDKSLEVSRIAPRTKIPMPGKNTFVAPSAGIKVVARGNTASITPVFSVLKDGTFQFFFFALIEKEDGVTVPVEPGGFECSGDLAKEFENLNYHGVGQISDCVFLKEKSYAFLMDCVKKGMGHKRKFGFRWNYKTDYFLPHLRGEGSLEVVLRYEDGTDYYYHYNGSELTEECLFGPAVITDGILSQRHGYTLVVISEIQNPVSLKKFLVLNIAKYGPEAMNAEVTETKKIFSLVNGRLEIVRGKTIEELLE